VFVIRGGWAIWYAADNPFQQVFRNNRKRTGLSSGMDSEHSLGASLGTLALRRRQVRQVVVEEG